MVGCPSGQDFEKTLCAGLVHNYPVMTTDIRIAQQLFGLYLASLKGKPTWSTPAAVRMDYVEVPNEIFERNKLVLLIIDIMSVNGLQFLVTLSGAIILVMAEYLSSMTLPNLQKVLHVIHL